MTYEPKSQHINSIFLEQQWIFMYEFEVLEFLAGYHYSVPDF